MPNRFPWHLKYLTGIMLALYFGAFIALRLAAAGASEPPTDCPGLVSKGDVWIWLYEDSVPVECVTDALNKLWQNPATLEEDEAALTIVSNKAPEPGRRAAALLIAVVQERQGKQNYAQTYAAVAALVSDTPYAASALFRLRQLEQSGLSLADQETFYQRAASDSLAGWFLMPSGQWTYGSMPAIAWQALAELRANRLPFRSFQQVRQIGSFNHPYAYIFLLLALVIGLKMLEWPYFKNAAQAQARLNQLQPELRDTQNLYCNQPVTLGRAMVNLCWRREAPVWSSYLLTAVDLLILLWMTALLGNFAPQLALDQAKFLWVADVTQFDLGILLIWLGLHFVVTLEAALAQTATWTPAQLLLVSLFGRNKLVQRGTKPPTLLLASVALGGELLIAALAWLGKWPAYVFIFWALLLVIGAIIGGWLQRRYRFVGAALVAGAFFLWPAFGDRAAPSTPAPLPSPTTVWPTPQWINMLNDQFEAPETEWQMAEVTSQLSALATVEQGKYRWQVEALQSQAFQWSWPALPPLPDYSIAVDVQPIGTLPTAGVGIVFRATRQGDLYFFGINAAQEYALLLFYQGEWRPLIDWIKSPAIRPNAPNHLTVVAEGADFTLVINGRQVNEAHDSKLRFGTVGVGVLLWTKGDTSDFEFDNFEVRVPTLPTPTFTATRPTSTATLVPPTATRTRDLIRVTPKVTVAPANTNTALPPTAPPSTAPPADTPAPPPDTPAPPGDTPAQPE